MNQIPETNHTFKFKHHSDAVNKWCLSHGLPCDLAGSHLLGSISLSVIRRRSLPRPSSCLSMQDEQRRIMNVSSSRWSMTVAVSACACLRVCACVCVCHGCCYEQSANRIKYVCKWFSESNFNSSGNCWDLCLLTTWWVSWSLCHHTLNLKPFIYIWIWKAQHEYLNVNQVVWNCVVKFESMAWRTVFQ